MSKVQCWLLANDHACLHGSNYFPFQVLFSWRVFYMLRLRSGTDLITYESELHGWVSKVPCPMLSHIGIPRPHIPCLVCAGDLVQSRLHDQHFTWQQGKCWSERRTAISMIGKYWLRGKVIFNDSSSGQPWPSKIL